VPIRAFEADPSVLRRLREAVRDDLAGVGIDDDALDDVILCVHEACMNAMQHGRGQLHVRWAAAPGEVRVEVCDEGDGVPLPAADAVPDAGQQSGRGLFLIRRLTHRFEASVDGGARCLAFAVPLHAGSGRPGPLGSAGFLAAN
jgi:anti-sigma regulatory factor (Ser/Thr protein kinase)